MGMLCAGGNDVSFCHRLISFKKPVMVERRAMINVRSINILFF